MSTPEIMLLMKIFPRVLREHPDWLSDQERETLKRMLNEMYGPMGARAPVNPTA